MGIKSLSLAGRCQRVHQLLTQIFEQPLENQWLKTGPDFRILGNIQDYIVILLSNKSDEKLWFSEEEFFEALRPHRRDYRRNEVIFNSGLTLNVRDILERPKISVIPVGRLVKRGFLGQQRTLVYLHYPSICKSANAKVKNDCITIDIRS